MIKIENTLSYNKTRQDLLSGKITSIWASDFYFNGIRSFPILPFRYITSNFSDFEKNLIADNKMVYHLSGYGTSYDEALVSYLGESAERYTFAVFSQLVSERIIKASYLNLVGEFGRSNVCSLDYVNTYHDESSPEYVGDSDEIYWIRMNSLINLGRDVYLPLQHVVSGSNRVYPEAKNYSNAAVSTGSASHETIQQALNNALIECLQIDSFELWWYGGIEGDPIQLDISMYLSKIFGSVSAKEFLENFKVSFRDISFDKGIPIVICEIISQVEMLPQYTVGVQGGTDYNSVIYRSLMEALSVLEYNMGLPWMDLEKWEGIKRNTTSITNFDDNVIFYAKYGKPPRKVSRSAFGSNANNSRPLDAVRKLSKYAGFLVITLPEFEDLNLEVVRVSIPELLTLSLPSFPPRLHPRFNSCGGISNNVPHPLA